MTCTSHTRTFTCKFPGISHGQNTSLFCFQMDSCDPEDPDEDVDEPQPDETQSWIGVIRIPVLEYYNARGSKACSVLERVSSPCHSVLLQYLLLEPIQNWHLKMMLRHGYL